MQELEACRKKGYRNILFTDCDMAKSEREAMDLIMSSVDFDKVFVAMTKKQLNNELASKLIFEDGFEKLEIPKLDDRYYECVSIYLNETGTVVFDDGLSVKKLNRTLHKKFGQMYSEEIISTAIDMAITEAEKDGRSFVREDDFNGVMECGKESIVSKLFGSVGRENFKAVVRESIALGREMQRNPKLDMRYENMVFSGKPGSGKTTAAEMYAQILSEEGLGNGKLVIAEKKDLIGSYLGQTAPKIAERFNEAKGGVLFVDEAGFFLGGDDYTTEAVREFVRYMECCPDVSVIFALYPHELNSFINLDAGLSSRIKRVVDFEDYSDEELVKIAGTMFKEQGYILGEGTENALKDYIEKQKNANPDNFGNARCMRKAVDASIVEISFRHIEEQKKKDEKEVDVETANKTMSHKKEGNTNQEEDTENALDMVLEEDIRRASKHLTPAKQEKSKMGFLA
jgi:adenylate kinase family enzyme